MRSSLVFVVLLLAMVTARADATIEERVLRLTETLRCLVCQNQTIAESNSDLARDMRSQVRAQLVAGKDEQQVVDFMMQRYGDFVLYRPPVKVSTWLLWFSPFVLLALACAGLVVALRRPRARGATDFTTDELKRAEALLHRNAQGGE